MADILEGTSDHQAFAPLSQAQTIAICKHLQAEIRSVSDICNENSQALQHLSEDMVKVKSKHGDNDAVHDLQVGLSDACIDISKLQNEIERDVQNLQMLMAGSRSSTEKTLQLEEAQKMMETRLEAISRELAQQRDTSKKVHDDIGNRINEDLRALQKASDNTTLILDQFSKEQKQITQLQKEDRSSSGQTDAKIESVLNEVKKSNTVISILENRLASTAKGVQQNWTKLADLSEGAAKLNDCYEKTRARVVECEGQIKQLGDGNKQTARELTEAVRQIERNTDRCAQALKLLDEEGAATEEMRHQINSVRQGGDNASRKLTSMSKEIIDIQATMTQLRAGVKEQSALLLPNIHMDRPDEAKEQASRYGSLLIGNNTDRSSRSKASGGTPRSARGNWS